MANSDWIPLEGTVDKILPGAKFIVIVNLPNGATHTVTATLAGRLWQGNIKILPKDKVRVELSVYDLSKGRIVWRYK